MDQIAHKLLATLFITLCIGQAESVTLYASTDGQLKNPGTENEPLSFKGAIQTASRLLNEEGLPKDGISIFLQDGTYPFTEPEKLNAIFKGAPDRNINILPAPGAKVIFDGSLYIDSSRFSSVTAPEEIKRLAKKSARNIQVAQLKNKQLIKQFNSKLMLNLSLGGQSYLPAAYPNEGYAKLKSNPLEPEVCPPGVPVGKQNYGIRAGNPPHQEPGKPQSWKGSLSEPRGAIVGLIDAPQLRGGTWQQWEAELSRNNKRNSLTGYIEANWLLSSQPIVGADAKTQTIHLSRALSYGWAWRNDDKPFRIFGLLCELDAPGEWYFDPLTDRLYIYPPSPLTLDSKVGLSVADGFLDIDGASFIHISDITFKNCGNGCAVRLGGHHNLLTGCTLKDSTATGVELSGTHNSVRGCNLIDLNRHIVLKGGIRSPSEITAGFNTVENCHIYQKKMRHEKVNISISGVGNRLANNLVHNSLGQAVTVNGNDHLIELNEFFNIGFDEGDGGAVYSGADMTGYGTTYRHNFFHHLMHVPGKVERSGIHLDDLQAGSICEGNIFYKSAGKGIFMNGGAGHTLRNNIFLEGHRGIYNVGYGAQKSYDRQLGINSDPDHMYKNTKENYIGRAEKIVGTKGWLKAPWKDQYPLFNEVMSDEGPFGRYWPIRCTVDNNFYFGNNKGDQTIWDRVATNARKKSIIKNDKQINPAVFVDYEALNLRIVSTDTNMPDIPFDKIGLYLDEYRSIMPEKSHYRKTIKAFFSGIKSMPGTTKRIDTAKIVEDGPVSTL